MSDNYLDVLLAAAEHIDKRSRNPAVANSVNDMSVSVTTNNDADMTVSAIVDEPVTQTEEEVIIRRSTNKEARKQNWTLPHCEYCGIIFVNQREKTRHQNTTSACAKNAWKRR